MIYPKKYDAVTVLPSGRSFTEIMTIEQVKARVLEMYPDREKNTDFFLGIVRAGGVGTIGGEGTCFQVCPHKPKPKTKFQ